MSWYSKVAWSEGLFLRQHHLQQNDRYIEQLLENRTRHISPYPWGFSALEIDRDLAQQNKFALRRGAAASSRTARPSTCRARPRCRRRSTCPRASDKQTVWLTMPVATANGREVDMAEAPSGSRYVRDLETIVDAASSMHVEQEIEVAHLRAAFDVRKTPKPGFHCLKVARILEVRDKTIVFDETFAPPVLVTQAHPVVAGWVDRVDRLGRHQARGAGALRRRPELGRRAAGVRLLHAADAQPRDQRPQAPAQLASTCIPSELYQELLRHRRRALDLLAQRGWRANIPTTTTTTWTDVFEPVLADIQRLLSLDLGRAIRLDLIQRGAERLRRGGPRPHLFRNATFVLEVAARLPLTQIQQQFPALCKVGPNTKMNEIVQTHLPGIELVHMPTPPRQIRAISDHVYFYLDKSSRALAGIQRLPAAWACTSPATGRTWSSTSGRSWKTADERQGRSVRLRAARPSSGPTRAAAAADADPGGGMPNPGGGMRPQPAAAGRSRAGRRRCRCRRANARRTDADAWRRAAASTRASPIPTSSRSMRRSAACRSGSPTTGCRGAQSQQQPLFPDRNQQPQQQAPTQKIPLEVALNARDGGAVLGRQPDHRGGGAAADPARPPAADDRRDAGRAADGARRQRDPAIRADGWSRPASSQEDARVAKYVLCATADDIVQNLPGTDRARLDAVFDGGAVLPGAAPRAWASSRS